MATEDIHTEFKGAGSDNPFSVPDSYFETFDQRLHHKIHSSKSAKIRFLEPSTIKRLAVAASLIGVLLVIGVLISRDNNTALTQNAHQLRSDSDLAVASSELINSIKITSSSIGGSDSLYKGKKKTFEVTDVSEQEVIDYMLGNDVEPLLVDL